jgi:hypothetical protein
MKLLARIFFVLMLGIAPRAAYALGLNVPFFPGSTEYTDIIPYIQDLYRFSLGAGAILAMAMITLGAIQYIMSAGNPGHQEDAKDRITSAVYGLILLLGSFLILYTVNPGLISLNKLDVPAPAPAPPPTEPPPMPTDLAWEDPKFTLSWKDNCDPIVKCSFVLHRAHWSTRDLKYFDQTYSQLVPFSPPLAGGRYSIRLDDRDILIDDLWRVQAETSRGALSPLQTDPEKFDDDPNVTVKATDFPGKPFPPTVILKKPRVINVKDESTNEKFYDVFLNIDQQSLLDDVRKVANGQTDDITGYRAQFWAYDEQIPLTGYQYPWSLPQEQLQKKRCWLMVVAKDAFTRFDENGGGIDLSIPDNAATADVIEGWGPADGSHSSCGG